MTGDIERDRDELFRQVPELGRAAVYEGWLVGYLPVDPATRTAAGVEVEGSEREPVLATWTPGRRYLFGQDQETGRWARYAVAGHPALPPQLEAFLVVSRARFGKTCPSRR